MMKHANKHNIGLQTDIVTNHIAEQSKLTSINLLGFILNEFAHYNDYISLH